MRIDAPAKHSFFCDILSISFFLLDLFKKCAALDQSDAFEHVAFDTHDFFGHFGLTKDIGVFERRTRIKKEKAQDLNDMIAAKQFAQNFHSDNVR